MFLIVINILLENKTLQYFRTPFLHTVRRCSSLKPQAPKGVLKLLNLLL